MARAWPTGDAYTIWIEEMPGVYSDDGSRQAEKGPKDQGRKWGERRSNGPRLPKKREGKGRKGKGGKEKDGHASRRGVTPILDLR